MNKAPVPRKMMLDLATQRSTRIGVNFRFVVRYFVTIGKMTMNKRIVINDLRENR